MTTTYATSADALRSIQGHAATLRQQVWDCMLSKGIHGLTDDEGQAILGMEGSTYRPRRQELQKAGKCCQSGEIRATRSGRSATVWIAVQ
jgi:hypothetical protein